MKVEWLILADAAQVVGNKLYLLGGGWDVLTVNTAFPVSHRCAVAASFKVPWTERDRQHTFEIEIATEDGATLATVNGQFEVGRPQGIPEGQDQRWQLAADLALTFANAGTYVIVARIGGEEDARVPFTVVPGAMRSGQSDR